MFKKIVIITAALFALLTCAPVSATVDASSQIPELNPFCWHRSDCRAVRKQFLIGSASDAELDQGFITDASVAPCIGGTKGGADEWGRCLPAGQTKTEISFGGQDKFSNIGEFILLMYKYLLTIASIVAVVVIIIAGAQWVTSGGNSEAISSAKKRIGGAVIGLFIAYMSYFVLNTINPALVNLRLPQVWLTKPVAMMPEFCADLPGATTTIKFSLVADSSEPDKPLPTPDKRGEYILYNVQGCGNRYLAENGGETTCVGNACEGEAVCFNKEGDRKKYECTDIRVAGNISNSGVAGCGLSEAVSGGAGEVWGCPPIADESLALVCNSQISGLDYRLGSEGETGHGQSDNHYWIEYPRSSVREAVQRCDFDASAAAAEMFTGVNLIQKTKGVKGFVVLFKMSLAVVVSGQSHFVGKGGVDLGSIDAAKDHLYQVKPEYLFTEEEILKGARLDVNAADIAVSEGLTDKQKTYYEGL